MRTVGLLRYEGLAIKPNLRLVPTLITISGGVDVIGDEERSCAKGNRLAEMASQPLNIWKSL
jgi:hypothetical protein